MKPVSAQTAFKDRLKTILYRSGLAVRLGRRASRRALTILMFHRVLPRSDRRSASADPDYTMDLPVFEALLDFLAKTYRPVSLAQVEEAFAGGAPLPLDAALVTFDDGWEDTARYAAPALKARGIPAVVFVTSGAMTCEYTLWRDVAAILARAGHLASPAPALPLEAWLEGLAADRRQEVLAGALDRAKEVVGPLMMGKAQLRAIIAQGMSIGAHGVSHTPLTSSDRPSEELRDSKSALEAAGGGGVSSFAFPHGRYNPAILQQTLSAGYRLVFTSDSILNRLEQGRPPSPVLGRIALSQDDVADRGGRFSPTRALFHLMFRPVAALDRKLGGCVSPQAQSSPSSY